MCVHHCPQVSLITSVRWIFGLWERFWGKCSSNSLYSRYKNCFCTVLIVRNDLALRCLWYPEAVLVEMLTAATDVIKWRTFFPKCSDLYLYKYRYMFWLGWRGSVLRTRATYDLSQIRFFKAFESDSDPWRTGLNPDPISLDPTATPGLDQCCGSGSEIRCLFSLWIRFRDEFFQDPGSF
jgi:hypothetical protein